MNKIFTLLFIVLFSNQFIQAQTVERSLVGGFRSSVTSVKPYDADSWLIAGRGEPEPGSFYEDTLFVAVVGLDGQIELRKNIQSFYSEVHYWHDVLALSDGGILAIFESTLCDVGADVLTIQKLDSLGDLVWEKKGGFVFGSIRPPEKWFVSTDGDLLGITYNQIWKVDLQTGDVFWKADLQGVDGWLLAPNFFENIPGTEDFVALGTPAFQIWKKTGDPLNPVYKLDNSLELPGYRNRLTPGPNGWFYCFQNFPINQIERFDLSLQIDTLPISIGAVDVFSFGVGDSGIFLSERSFDQINRSRKFDLLGQNEVEFPAPSTWFTYSVTANKEWVVFGGQETNGPSTWNAFLGAPAQSTGAWIRIFPWATPSIAFETPNIAVSGIEQQSVVDTSSLPWGQYYTLSGGNFRIKITNLGNQIIHSVALNTSFSRDETFDICFRFPALQKQFFNLNLNPGESIWLPFGDIQVTGQEEIPAEICFWTSSPNELPDAVHEDDRACHPASYIVSTKTPNITQVALTPNPANDFTTLVLAEKLENEPWRIFDTSGQVVSAGVSDADQTLRLETAQLPNGIYFFYLKNRVGKLVVQH